jgi:TonB family protein
VRSEPDFLTLTRNVVAFPRRDGEARLCLLPDSIALADDLTSLPDDRRYEPELAATPYLIEFGEIDRLDPERAEIPPAAKPASPPTWLVVGLVASLLIHLVTVILILLPGFETPVAPQAIPIQLVLETPPPPPPVPDKMAAPPPEPHGHLASEDIGDLTAKSGQAPEGNAPEATAKPAPAPAPTLVQPPPEKPIPPKDQVATLAEPKIPPPILQHPQFSVPPAAHPAEGTHVAAHPARVPGPSATRDEYLAYLVTLTKQHFDLLPVSMLGGRTGETSLAILVLADGTIARISVAQSSGYADVDNKIEQMVAACRHFPPLPQWYQGQSMELIFKLHFPEALERR